MAQALQDLEHADPAPEAWGFFENERLYSLVDEQPAVLDELPELLAVRLASGFQSHPGGARENNEDSLVAFQLSGMCEQGCATALGLFAVADGVGGSQSGELASKAAIEGLTAHVMQMICLPELQGTPVAPDRLADELKKAVDAANRSILALHEQLESHDMGCTMTAALVRGLQAVVANVGDSRTYLMRDGHLTRITQDHSLVARMVEQGVLHEDEVYSHQYRNVILRSLGFQSDLEVDIHQLELQSGDRLLLCSDGLWETLCDPMIEDILLEPSTPQQACDRLIEPFDQR